MKQFFNKKKTISILIAKITDFQSKVKMLFWAEMLVLQGKKK